MGNRKTVTVRVSGFENEFLESMIKKKEYPSSSDIVRQGIHTIMEQKGYKKGNGKRTMSLEERVCILEDCLSGLVFDGKRKKERE